MFKLTLLVAGITCQAGVYGMLCWPGMDQTKWPCSDEDYPVFAQSSNQDILGYQNIQGACTPCRSGECDENLKLSEKKELCGWHGVPEFPRVYFQNTGTGCHLCVDGFCEPHYGTFRVMDDCQDRTRGKPVKFQQRYGECRPCFEGHNCLADLVAFESRESCQKNIDKKDIDFENVQITFPLSKLCITCRHMPCPPMVKNACPYPDDS